MKLKWNRILVIPLVIAIIGVWLLWPHGNIKAGWYDENYSYRKKLYFTHNASITSERRVTFTIDTRSGAGQTLEGKIQSDCDDVRFTDISGKLLRYQFTGTCNNAATTFDVVIPTIFNGTDANVVYFYYGSATATSGSQDVSAVTSLTPSGSLSTGSEETGPAPVLSWSMNEGYGTTLNDDTLYTNTGTFGTGSSAPTWVIDDSCSSGKCLKFDGTNDYVSRAYSSDNELDPSTNSFSVTAWFNHPIAIGTTQTVIARVDGANGNGVGYKIYMKPDGTMCFGIDQVAGSFPANSACSTTTYNDSQWHNITGVKDTASTNIYLYIDGNQITSTAYTAGSLSGSSPTFHVGIDNGKTSPWNGFIDDVRIYPYAKSAAQIQSGAIRKAGINSGSGVVAGAQDTSFLNKGLVAFWKMDENTGITSSDSSGNSNTTSTFTGNTTWASGKFGSALTFDGTDDVVRIPESTATDLGANTDSYTVSTWFNSTSAPGSENALVAKNGSGSAYPIYLYLASGGQITFKIYDGASTTASASSSQTYLDGVWHHVVGIRDRLSRNVRLYVDGNLIQTTTDNIATSLVNDSDISIGNGKTSYTTSDFKGTVDEVRIYNRALSTAEVRALYNFAPGPVGYWNFDENTGTAANDRSGNSHTGTLTNGPTWTTGKAGPATHFDGSDDYIAVADSTVLDTTKDAFTLEAWIYDTDVDDAVNDDRMIISKGDSPTSINNTYRLRIDNTKVILLQISDGTTTESIITTTRTIAYSTWTHVAATYNGTAASVYINGVLDTGPTARTVGALLDSGQLDIGRQSSLDCSTSFTCFDGNIDDVRIYNYARTPAQIIEDMNGGHPIGGSPIGSQAGYWRFNEGYSTTAHDDSINQNDLTLSSARWTTSGKFGVAFDGSSSFYASRADDADFDFLAAEDFTLSAWIKSDANAAPTAVEYMVNKSSATAAGYGMYGTTAGKVVFAIDDDATWTPDDLVTSNTNVYDNAWHYVAARKTGTSRIDLFVDGKLEASDTSLGANGSLSNSISFFVGGRGAGTSTFNGDIDEVKIYRGLLTDDQILIDYNQGQSTVMGAKSTASDGITADNSQAREYCVPGDTSTCTPPISEWKLDENTGTSTDAVKDTSGNNAHGTMHTSMTVANWVPGKFGSALQFDTVDDNVLVTQASLYDFGTATEFTIEGWVKMLGTGKTTQTIFQTNPNTLHSMVQYRVTVNNIRAWIGDGTGTSALCSVDGATDIEDGKWHHIAVVYNRDATCSIDDIDIYIDGKYDTVSLINSTAATNVNLDAASFEMSNDGGSNQLNGMIDQVRIYNYARTPAQIAWDYNHGGPVGWWRFDECQGTTAYDSSPNNNDSITGNNGTITIGATGNNTSAGTCTGSAGEAWKDGVNGKIKGSLEFDGTDDKIIITDPSNGVLDFPANQQFSIALWVKGSNKAQFQTFLSKRDTAGYQLYFEDSIQKVQWRIDEGGANVETDFTTDILDGNWHHVVVGRDSTKDFVYVDGKLNASTSDATLADLSNTFSLDIAHQESSAFFVGQLDDIRIFNYALTPIQIKNVFNDGSAVRFAPITGSP